MRYTVWAYYSQNLRGQEKIQRNPTHTYRLGIILGIRRIKSLNNIIQLILLMEPGCVLCDVGNKFLNIMYMGFALPAVKPKQNKRDFRFPRRRVWDFAPCSSLVGVYRCFRGAYCLHHQDGALHGAIS
jgi:hypothetical protein